MTSSKSVSISAFKSSNSVVFMRKFHHSMENNKSPLHIMVVEPRGSGGMIHYAYQLCTGLSNTGAKVTLVTSDEYEMENFSHNFTVRKQMKLWSPTETSQTESAFGWVGRMVNKSYRAARRVFRGVR